MGLGRLFEGWGFIFFRYACFAGLNLLRGKMFGMGSGVTAEVGFVFAIFVWTFLFHLLSSFFSFVTEWCAQGRFLHSSILMSSFFSFSPTYTRFAAPCHEASDGAGLYTASHLLLSRPPHVVCRITGIA
jgi:hypothetical protein